MENRLEIVREIGKVVSGGGVCGYKKETGGITEKIELFYILTVAASISWLW